MMNTTKTFLPLFSAAVLFSVPALAQVSSSGPDSDGIIKHTKTSMEVFPKAKDGKKRFVINLPDKGYKKEGELKVELIVGKTILSDGVNRMGLSTQIQTHDIPGWGYVYYEVDDAPVMSTMIGVPPGAKQEKRFVIAEPLMLYYNSRTPIVVYVPEGYEVRYRIWKPEKEHSASEG